MGTVLEGWCDKCKAFRTFKEVEGVENNWVVCTKCGTSTGKLKPRIAVLEARVIELEKENARLREELERKAPGG